MTLYRGRVNGEYGGLMNAINRSLPVDIRLLPYDVLTNRAWAAELQRLGVLTAAEFADIAAALNRILVMHQEGAFTNLPADEDVHTLVERLLTEQLGPTGAKIHTGRSRNDQVVTDTRLMALDCLAELLNELRELIALTAEWAATHAETLLAGTTHLQPAQPITLGFFFLSLAFALRRDHERLADARTRTDCCPLGSGALAGSAFAVDRAALARALGFAEVCPNALDAISDRDFVQEIAGAIAMLGSHLSRYAEQFIIWAHPAFGFVRFADDWSTGSSMMPQKRNPDAMELVRAKAARCLGDSVTLLTLTKGLAPSYSKDLQEDKAALFDSLDTALLAVQVFRQSLQTATFNVDRLHGSLTFDLLATEIADALTHAGIPFRRAHERVGEFFRRLDAESRSVSNVTDIEWQAAFPELPDSSVARYFAAAVERRQVLGGAAPAEVRRQCRELQLWLRKNQ